MNRIVCPGCKRYVFEASFRCIYCGVTLDQHDEQPIGRIRATRKLAGDREPATVMAHEHALLDGREQKRTGDLETQRRATWQKIVETPSRPSASYAPRPPRPPQSLPLLRHIPYGSPFRSTLFIWLSSVALFLAVCGGVFGLTQSFGHSVPPVLITNEPTLVAQPSIVSAGSTITLHGEGYTAGGMVGLYRDNSIPVSDQQQSTQTYANAQGIINTVVYVGANWGSGEHTIMAEDAATHKISSFPLQVIGKTGPLRPAHLHVSTNVENFGAGDQATNTLQMVELNNSGSGQISWQGTTSQPWLMISPRAGLIEANQTVKIAVAVNRYNLAPGNYSARIFFTSDAGTSVLDVTMQVTPLVVENNAVLQLTPALLDFTSHDGDTSPDPQVMTVSNPGNQTLSWHATASPSWLSLAQSSGTILPLHSSAIPVSVQTGSLLPGTYTGDITFAAQGSVMHSPQHVFVSVTIVPQCSAQVSPGVLYFNSNMHQGVSGPQTLTISSTASCTAPLHWSAKSDASWATLSASSGDTPGSPTVKVNPAGLAAGTYKASITISTATGSQVVLVSFALDKGSAPGLSVTTSALDFQGVVNGGNPNQQMLGLINTGQERLRWHVYPLTDNGSNWLSVSSTQGVLGPQQSTALEINVSVLDKGNTPGRSTGMLKIIGQDSTGAAVPGSPLYIPVKLMVNAACSLNISQNVLTFSVYSGSSTPDVLPLTIVASNTCRHPIIWNAVARTNTGSNWLVVVPDRGILSSSTKTAVTQVGIVRRNLFNQSNQTYYGFVQITAFDTVTHRQLGNVQIIDVTLNVQPPCTLQTLSNTQLAFHAIPGSKPAAQTFQVGVVGTCNSGSVTIVPTSVTSGKVSWLKVTPTAMLGRSGTSATFSVTVDASQLSTNHYAGSISVAALMGGIAIVGSPQTITVLLDVASVPVLSTDSLAGLHFDMNIGDNLVQTITVSNTGGGHMNWSANMQSNAPSFMTLSNALGTRLSGGSAASFSVSVDTSNATPGTYTTAVIISATNADSLRAARANISIPVTISIATPTTVTPVSQPTPESVISSPTPAVLSTAPSQ